MDGHGLRKLCTRISSLRPRRGRRQVSESLFHEIKADLIHLQLYAEIMIHKLMAHPHVVPFREAFEDEDQVYILLGLCEYGVSPYSLLPFQADQTTYSEHDGPP
jgi:serine/threonine protein kinase